MAKVTETLVHHTNLHEKPQRNKKIKIWEIEREKLEERRKS